METERRAWKECRAQSDGARITGHAIVFDSQSENLGGFVEVIAPEAVDRALSEGADVRALVDHDSGKVIGRTRAGTMTMVKDGKGLKVMIQPDTEISYARDIMRAVARGDVSGFSFGFQVLSDSWDYEQKTPLRTILDMRLAEISVVAFPAYAATDASVAMRSLQAFQAAKPMRDSNWYDTKLRLAR
jgi:HK97 family phage prohead protease